MHVIVIEVSLHAPNAQVASCPLLGETGAGRLTLVKPFYDGREHWRSLALGMHFTGREFAVVIQFNWTQEICITKAQGAPKNDDWGLL